MQEVCIRTLPPEGDLTPNARYHPALSTLHCESLRHRCFPLIFVSLVGGRWADYALHVFRDHGASAITGIRFWGNDSVQ